MNPLIIWIFLAYLASGLMPILAGSFYGKATLLMLPLLAAMSAAGFVGAGLNIEAGSPVEWVFGLGLFFATVMVVITVAMLDGKIKESSKSD